MKSESNVNKPLSTKLTRIFYSCKRLFDLHQQNAVAWCGIPFHDDHKRDIFLWSSIKTHVSDTLTCHSTSLTIALACLFSLLCWTRWRLDFKADWKERSDEVVMTSVASTPAVLKAQLHWLHNKISSSPPAISKRLPHSGQKVSEPMILAGDSVAMLRQEKVEIDSWKQVAMFKIEKQIKNITVAYWT